MLVDDLYLYAAFAIGWAAGRVAPSRRPWLGGATLGCVGALLFLLGASFRSIAPVMVAHVLPLALAFVTLTLALTVGVGFALRRPPSVSAGAVPPTVPPQRHTAPVSLLLLGALVIGYGVGRAGPLPTGVLIEIALAALLGLVGYGIELTWAGIRRAWVPLTSAGVGAVGAAAVFVAVGALSPRAALSTGLGFGWYSLTGPLVGARLGATLGLLAFLANFVRELSVMLLSPYLGPRIGAEGLSALGGATSMDTNLYFIVRYGDHAGGAIALSTGLTLTVAASLLVPFVLAL